MKAKDLFDPKAINPRERKSSCVERNGTPAVDHRPSTVARLTGENKHPEPEPSVPSNSEVARAMNDRSERNQNPYV